MRRERKEKLSEGAASGVVALIFLIVGFQLALFVTKVVKRPPEALPDEVVSTSEAGQGAVSPPGHSPGQPHPETQCPAPGAALPSQSPANRARSAQSAERTRYGGYPRPDGAGYRNSASAAPRKYESFPFDPNTVSLDDLVRLGLSRKQAESIENYRSKGGRFRRKEDFAKMYVVSDTLYSRLEPYIELARLELNSADSAALLTLRGIGPYYASKIIRYRERLGGFHDAAQLMEIDGIDEERFNGFSESVRVDTTLIKRIDLWSAPEERLAEHPYLGEKFVRALERFKGVCDTSEWTIENLSRENIITNRRIFVYLKDI